MPEFKAEENKVEITSLYRIGGFHFFIEVVTEGPFVDPFSKKPREYFVEYEQNKKRVSIGDAMKFGMIDGIPIPNSMFEFLHEYDKNLD